MPVQIVSTTDTPEEVTAAMGNLVDAKTSDKVEDKTAADKTAEKKAASEATTDKETTTEVVDETAEEKTAREAVEAKAKKKGGYQKKISRLTKEREDARRETEFWRGKAEAGPAAKVDTKVETKSDGKPDVEKFSDHADYVEALTDWKLDQKLASEKQKSAEVALRAESQKKAKTHIDRVEKFKSTTPDFQDVVDEIGDVPISLTFQQIILDSENGPEIMYNLAKDPEEYKRIQGLGAIAAAREIGKFEAKIAKTAISTELAGKQTTKAPAPIAPVTKGKVTAEKDPEKMNQREYNAWRDAGGGR